jgi:CRISPR-associated protein (TIGR02710 family)
MAKWTLVLTVGTTAEPLLRAIEETKQAADRESASLSVILVYGRPTQEQQSQENNTLNITKKLIDEAKKLGLAELLSAEIDDPENLDTCLREMKRQLNKAIDADRVLVNYTGGTKVMSAAAVHAALTAPLAGNLELSYVGGGQRDETGRVVSEAMTIRPSEQTFTRERAEQIINLLRNYRFEPAKNLAEVLPDSGRFGFLKRATTALSFWDNLEYDKAVPELRELNRQAKALSDDPDLGKLAQIIDRLTPIANAISDTIRVFRQWEEGKTHKPSSEEGMRLLCADLLENAYRHIQRKEYTEAVLRSYRALEAAVQVALVMSNRNPWRYTPSQSEQEAVKSRLGHVPKELTLSSGVEVLKIAHNRTLNDELKNKLLDLQQLRNRSILEHGYRACSKDDSERALSYAETLVLWVLDTDIMHFQGFRERVRLQM